MTLEETIEYLQYIIDSPLQKHGGFHPNIIEIAKSALQFLKLEHACRVAAEELANYFIDRHYSIYDLKHILEYIKWQSTIKAMEADK